MHLYQSLFVPVYSQPARHCCVVIASYADAEPVSGRIDRYRHRRPFYVDHYVHKLYTLASISAVAS